MIRAGFAAVALTVAVLSFIVAAAFAQGQAQGTLYPRMAPLQKNLMPDRNAEIALARTAAPPAITLNATVLILTPHGYQLAGKGSNGFTCLVERSWSAPFSNREFWNWKNRSPTCYNPEASRSVLLYTLRRTDAQGGRRGRGHALGGESPGSPVVFDRPQRLDPEPWALFFVPLSRRSDGSPAPQM